MSSHNGGPSGYRSTGFINEDQKIDPETGLQPTQSARRGSFVRNSIVRKEGYEYEDPFGDEEGAEVQYRTLEWWQAAMIMIAETVSLGILSLPSVLARVGFAPGVILICGLSVFATYSGYVLGQFKERYPHIHTFADAGEVLFTPLGLGWFGKEFFGAAQTIFLIFSMANHVLTWTIMFNTVVGMEHHICTIGGSVVGLVLFILFDIPRTMKNLSFWCIMSFASIIVAVLVTMIGAGVDPAGPMIVEATKPSVEFATAFNSVSNIVYAYAGHVSFFSFISEFRNPREFPKALYLLQFCDTAMYIIVAIVVYYYSWDPATGTLASPAIGALKNEVVKRVAWGIAIPTIVIAGVIYGHVASKYIFVRIFRGTRHLSSRSWLATGTWSGIVVILWILAWIIAESIPVFNDLSGLISALFAAWFTYGLSGIFWLFMNKGKYFSSARKIFLTFFNLALLGLGLAICGIGLYASGKSIHDDSKSSAGKSWTCAYTGQ